MRFVAFRHAAYDTPWWASPSRRAGRFHRAGQRTTQYLCLHPLGPAAEMLRHNLGPHGDPDDVILNLWTAKVDVDAVTEIGFDDCAAHGINARDLVGEDYTPTQALADAIRDSGAAAMVVPSAALPGTDNLILFGARVLHPLLWEPVSVEETPTGHLTDGARAAAEVVAHVRWFGATHTALERWEATGAYDLFEDPLATR